MCFIDSSVVQSVFALFSAYKMKLVSSLSLTGAVFVPSSERKLMDFFQEKINVMQCVSFISSFIACACVLIAR